MLQYTARITSQDTPRVGGRNLITRASLRKVTTDDGYGFEFESDKYTSFWLSYGRDYPQAKAGDTVTLSMLIRCDKSEWGASEWSIRVADSQGTLKYLEPNKEVFGEFYKHVWTFDLREDGKLPIIQLYNHIFRRDKDGNIKFNKHVEAKYIKLEFGTIATDFTPAPEDVAESVTSLESKLLDPEQGEIHKLTSQLTTSAQQTLAEAVKRAGEMDREIKVGGRNLILGTTSEQNSLSWTDWYSSTNIKSVRGLTAGTYTLSFQLHSYEVQDREEGKLGVHMYVRLISKDNREIDLFVDPFMSHSVLEGKYVCTFTIDDTDFDVLWFRFRDMSPKGRKTISYSSIKLERGTIATDWTPAPEDLDDRISNVSTSLTSLASTLLDPNEGDIPQLFSQLESHKKATDKSFEDLATHPLTIDDNGYWQVWSVKDSKYLTTQYKSRGDKGDKGEDAGRYLGRAKRIHPDFNGNYLLETENSWRTAKEGDYVYLVGDLSNRGGDKDTYYIVREHKSKTVWEVYDIKGRTAHIEWHGTSLVVDDQPPVDLRGEAGHSPSPKEVLDTPHFSELLGTKVTSEVTTQVKPVNTKLTDLDKRSLTFDQKRDLGFLTYSLRSLRSGSNGNLEGLALQRYIALSGDNQTVSAYLASNALPAVLKAGITGFGTPQEREQVEITHAGTGHIGNLYFQGNQIDFRTGQDTDPYLSIGAEESTFIDGFVSQARLNDTPVIVSSVTLTTTAAGIERPINIDNDGTRLTIHIDKLFVAVFGVSKLRLTLDGETLAEWRGSEEIHLIEGGNYTTSLTPYEATNLTYERVVKAGSHTVRLSIINPTANYTATINGLRIKRRYDTGAQQSALTRSGLRLFGSPDRYFDVDYRQQVPAYFNGLKLKYTTPNDYTVRIKGGAKIDKLTADELDMPGVPLCGATFSESGGCINSFGARAKQQGTSVAQAYRAYNADFYRVYHSIGHKNYIPVLQVYGLSNNNHTQCLTTRIDAIEANSFAVRIVTTGNVSIKHSFSYVAFKTT